MRIEHLFQILAVAFGGAAVYFLSTSNSDGAFAAGVLAAVSFFLNLRFRATERNKIRAAENVDEEI